MHLMDRVAEMGQSLGMRWVSRGGETVWLQKDTRVLCMDGNVLCRVYVWRKRIGIRRGIRCELEGTERDPMRHKPTNSSSSNWLASSVLWESVKAVPALLTALLRTHRKQSLRHSVIRGPAGASHVLQIIGQASEWGSATYIPEPHPDHCPSG